MSGGPWLANIANNPNINLLVGFQPSGNHKSS
jgi:hypothetical protein